MADVETLIKQSDLCSTEKRWEEGVELLTSYHNTDDPHLLWRIVRDLYRKSKYFTKNPEEAKSLAKEGLQLAEKAISIDKVNFLCFKWAGIILSYYSGLIGNKEKIISAVQVREYFEKAIELNPNDMPSKHLLGRWHFNVANVPWYVRSAAKYVYATPPSSTFQEALKHFEAAEKLNDVNFVDNWLYLAKTHYQLGDKAQAKKWADKVLAYGGAMSPDILEAQRECQELMKRL